MKLIAWCFLFVTVLLPGAAALAQDCSNLPTQFTGGEFPSGDFFTNFQNSCYLIPFAPQGPSKTDLNDTYWQMFYKVDPRYQIVVVGSFPNSRYFSVSAYDDHHLLSQSILDTNIVPLTSSYMNPFQVGVPYAEGQQYAVPLNFGGTPGNIETGCMTSAYNVDVNALDATLRHQGLDWNTDPGYMSQTPTPELHIVDTPQHTNPSAAGYVMARAYVDINFNDPTTVPAVIVRDVASGCAYPAAYAQNVLQIVSPAGGNPWLNQSQQNGHQAYDHWLPNSCYATDPQNAVGWSRGDEFINFPNPNAVYVNASLPTNIASTLAAAGEVMRLRVRVPNVPPTPCTDGCSRSGNEQMRYMGISMQPAQGDDLASVGDYAFTTDVNGYATLIVGTGAAIPSWITPANGYTFLDMTTIQGYQNLSSMEMRYMIASPTFACNPQLVPYKTSIYGPQGNLIGDYIPEVDYPLAANLPLTTSELIDPSSCGSLPDGVPEILPSCGLLPPNPTVIASMPAQAPGESPVAIQPLPPITLNGAGFGYLPQGLPFTGNSNYLEVADLTQGWTAGMTGSPCNLSIGLWQDSRVEFVANVDQNGLCPMAPGDQLAVSVSNPQTGSGPITSTVTVASDITYQLGTSSMIVGSAAGNGAVDLITNGPWTASSNAAWLQLSSTSVSGVGNTPIQFAYPANSSANPQTGTLKIAGLTFTVTQAGNTYTPVAPVTPLVTGLNGPQGVALDSQGNIYIADTGNAAIEQFNPTTQQFTPLITSGLVTPTGVAIDAYGNIYIADAGNQAIEQWNANNPQLNPVVSGLLTPYGVAVDSQGNVYYSDSGANSIAEWSPSTVTAATLASGSLLNGPMGVALDGFGNVYFANSGNNAIDQWNIAGQQANLLASSALSGPTGVAVDGQGNVDFSDTGNNAIKQWNAASQQVVTWVSSGLNGPAGVALDAQGNLYVADRNNNAIEKVSFGYLALSATSLNEIAAAGSDSVTAQIIPATTPIAAASDQSWLTITGVSGGVVAFAFQANTTGASRVAHVIVSGQAVTVTQAGDTLGSVTKTGGDSQSTDTGQPFAVPLQVTASDINGNPLQGLPVTFTAVPGPNGASGTFPSGPPIVTDQNGNAMSPPLTANNIGGAFTVTATVDSFTVTFYLTNLPYNLAVSSVAVSSLAGSGSVLLVAGGSWTATSNAPWLTLSANSQSGAGNAVIEYSYAANPNSTAQTGTISVAGLTYTVTQAPANYLPAYPLNVVISSGLATPKGLALDGQGNLYVADSTANTIYEWNLASQQLTALVTGLNKPSSVALDSQGNVYFTDSGNNAVKEWNVVTQAVTTLASAGLNYPYGVAVDGQGNVYFSDSQNNAIKEWLAASGTVTTLIASTLKGPAGVAIDSFGNIYIADNNNKKIKEWSPITKAITTLVSSGLKSPVGVAVDGGGNVYFTDSTANKVEEWSPATDEVTILASAGLSTPSGVAVGPTGNPYVSDTSAGLVKRITPGSLSLSTTSLNEGEAAGTDSVTAQVFPLNTPITAQSNESWLTVTGVSGGVVDVSFTANNSVDSRSAKLSVSGVIVTVTQAADTAAAIAQSAGANQSAAPGKKFATALAVEVTDASGSPVQGVPVTFTVVPGTKGAGGTFKSSPPMPILTDSSGIAAAPTLIANTTVGTFHVTATSGSLTTTFTLKIAKK